ncbi:MAG: hypothetical protein ACRD0K_21010 [Egibacteraceae bacterium]
MSAAVTLALSVMVMSLGAALVAAVALKRAAGSLTGGVKATLERVQPLVDELAEGSATTTAEGQSLQRSVEGMKRLRTRQAR